MAESSNGLATEEIRCPKCEYNLFGLTEFRCPECGTPFDPEDLAARTHLLPWERPELGGRLLRLRRTIILASLHPGRYFSAINQRKDRQIENAGSFVKMCVTTSLSFYVVAFLLGNVAFFLRLTWKHGVTQKIFDSTFAVFRVTVLHAWFLPSLQILSSLLSVFLISVFFSRVFRSRCNALRTIDLTATFSPAIMFGAFIGSVCQIVLAISQFRLVELVEVMVWSEYIVLSLLVWHFCRKLLVLSLVMTLGTVIACGIIQYGCDMLVSFICSQIHLAILF